MRHAREEYLVVQGAQAPFVVHGNWNCYLLLCPRYPGAPTLKAGSFQRRGLVTPGSPNLRRPKDCQRTFFKPVDY